LNALATSKAAQSRPLQSAASCNSCPPFDLNVWLAICGNDGERAAVRGPKPVSEHTIPARRMILRERDLHDVVPFICKGWAASAVTLSDGSRQILAFLLAGDIVSTSLLFGAAAHCSVEAITEVHYRSYRRDELREVLLSDRQLIEKAAKLLLDRTQRAQQLAVDLGRRTADERIARLILDLQARLAERGMAHGQTIDFPLRQHHVADATGLTSVHVSKVLTEFRRRGLIEISDRSLTILDPAGFQRVATMR
jgi:CRP/FNR family transcriptional regulator, anaerobic regulatory protein